ncbi:MAG: glycine cleavage T C-terminal barrel domain-containing protein [Verrucomicrobiota bacterium]
MLDDLIVYREAEGDSYFLVINAACRERDVAWMRSRQEPGIQIEDESDGWGGMAVQGGNACELLDADWIPPRFSLRRPKPGVVICRTGYTGEDGFEFFAPRRDLAGWWQKMLAGGAVPCGLGARDSLRLEKAYPLNGSDLTPSTSPLEAGLGRFVDLEKGGFVGREVLLAQKAKGLERSLVAVKMLGKSPPPRPGYPMLFDGKQVGTLTSGGLSPTLGTGIGMGYVERGSGAHRLGTEMEIEIRGKGFSAEVVRKPFV